MTITIELSEKEAADLDRYVEEGCYDRDKIIKREILRMIAGPGPSWHLVPHVKTVYPAWEKTTTLGDREPRD
jgi:hypothetical protein